jgi:multidrug transporter EmrE-like cation transporter
MSTRGLILILAGAFLTSGANLLLRHGVRAAGGFGFGPNSLLQQILVLLQQPTFVVGMILYGLAAFVWFAVVGVEDLSISYPAMVGVVFVLVNTGAVFFFGEHISPQKLIGMLVILTGVVIVART